MTTSTSRSDCGRVARREGDRFQASRFVLPRGVRTPSHAHALPGLVVVGRGSFRATVEGRTLEARPGVVMVLPAGAEHLEAAGPDGMDCLLVEPRPGGDPLPPGAGTLLSTPRCIPAPGAGSPGWASGTGPPGSALPPETGPTRLLDVDAAELLLSLLTGRGDPSRAEEAPAWMDRVAERLRDDPRPPSLEELAALAGVSQEHLARTFRRHFGCTVGDFLRHRRLVRAVRGLREPARPLSGVAYAAGFTDQSHMNRWFRRTLGLTPGSVRRAVRRDGTADGPDRADDPAEDPAEDPPGG